MVFVSNFIVVSREKKQNKTKKIDKAKRQVNEIIQTFTSTCDDDKNAPAQRIIYTFTG